MDSEFNTSSKIFMHVNQHSMFQKLVKPLRNVSRRTKINKCLWSKITLIDFYVLGSGLIEEQDKGDHNGFEELQRNGLLKNYRMMVWFFWIEVRRVREGRSFEELWRRLSFSNDSFITCGSDVDTEEDIEATFERVPVAIVRKMRSYVFVLELIQCWT